MKAMKREKVEIPEVKRKNPVKRASVGVILFCLGVMALSVAKGIELDKKEAEENKVEEDKFEENKAEQE